MNKIELLFLAFFIFLFAPSSAQSPTPTTPESCPLDTVNGEEVYRYQVEKSIGLYRIGVTFNVPQSEIVRLNPQLKERGLHFGETLLIPTGRKVETLKETPAPQEESTAGKEERPEPKDLLKPLATIATAVDTLPNADTTVMDTTASSTPDTVRVITVDTVIHGETFFQAAAAALQVVDSLTRTDSLTVDSLRVDSAAQDTVVPDPRRIIELALMLPFESQQTKRSANAERIMEFYQGALLALHDLQNDSTLYRLRVYDTERSDRRVAALTDTACTELNNVRGILGLAYPVQIERVGEWCLAHEVPMILPFSDDLDLTGKPQVMQFNTTDAQEAQAVVKWIRENEDTIHCIVVDAREAEIAGSVRELRKALRADSIPYRAVSIMDVLNDSLYSIMQEDRQNLIILHSDKYNRVRTMIPHIEQCAIRGYDVTLLSQYLWLKEDIHLPQIFTSVFTADTSLEAYEKLWNTYFHNEHQSSIPRYDLLGYDLMSQLVAIIKGETLTHGLQSDILWHRDSEEDGWQNTNVKVVKK